MIKFHDFPIYLAIPYIVVVVSEVKLVIAPTSVRFLKPKYCGDIVKKIMISKVCLTW
jgi:hypothetical protein